MRKFMPIVNEIEGRAWCEENGVVYFGTRIHPEYGFVMEYEDGLSNNEISSEEEAYYLEQMKKEEKRKESKKKNWVVASDDGINSTMYKSQSSSKKSRCTFYLTSAELYTETEAKKVAAIMTQRSRTNRYWRAVKII